MSEQGSQKNSYSSSSWQPNPNSSQYLATASTAEIRFILDENRRDALHRMQKIPPELHEITYKYYCDIFIEDSALSVKWKAHRLPPKSLIEFVTGRIETFIRNAVEQDKLACLNFSAILFYPEIRDQGYLSLLAGRKNLKFENLDNGWYRAEVSGTDAEVNDSQKYIRELVTQYTDEKLIVDEVQYRFLDVALQCTDSFRMPLLASTSTVDVRMKACRYICLNGRKDEVEIVAERIYMAVSKLVNEVLPLPTFVVNWLVKKHCLDSIQQLLIQQNAAAALQVKDGTLYAISDSKSTLETVTGILKNDLTWQPVEAGLEEQRDLLNSAHHNPELSLILSGKADLVVEEGEQIWYLICKPQDVSEMRNNLDNFFKKNMLVERKVECSEAHIAFICQYLDTDLEAIAKLGDQSGFMKLKISFESDGFLLIGNTELVDVGHKHLSQLVKQIQEGLCTVEIVPNVQELLKGHISAIEKQTETIIRLLDPDLLNTTTRYPSLSEHVESTCSPREHSVSAGYNASASEDIVIRPVWSELCDVKADVLVNSINWELEVNRGKISGSLSRRAGPSLQAELSRRYPKGLEFFHYAVTKSHNVGCRAIIHVACAPYRGKYTEDRLLSLFVDCLNEAEKKKAASIAFPAIGTGNLDYPPATVFKLLHDAVAIFRKDRKTTSLRAVFCSLIDPQHREPFEKCIKENLNRNVQQNSFKTRVPGSPVLSITFKKLSVQIMRNVPSRKLHMVIKFDGTKKLRKEGAPSGNNPGYVHIDKDVDLTKLPAALESAIRSSESVKANSLSIVAHKNDKKTARCIAETVCNYFEQGGSTITEIFLIVTDDQLSTYCQTLLASCYQPEYPLSKTSWLDRLYQLPLIGSAYSYFTKQAPRSCDASDDALVIAIYGISHKKIQEAEFMLSSLLSKECVIEELTCHPDDVSILDEKQINALGTLESLFNTRISVHLEQEKIFIRGSRADVDRTREKVKDFLASARHEFFQSNMKRQRLELAKLQAELVQWQYQDDSGTWTNFDEITSMLVEDCHEKKTVCSRVQSFIGDFEYDPVTNPTVAYFWDGTRRKSCLIRRIDVKAWQVFPKEWIYSEKYIECIVPKDTDEYNTIESEFLNNAGASANEVLEIKRIQDPHAWNMFKIQEDKAKCFMIDKFEPCTRRLWHGTSPETVSAILNDHRFNRSFAGDEVLYGKGVYFARDASYAAQPQYARSSGGTSTIILAQVITGCFTKGTPSMTMPPKRLDPTGWLYDSTVDDEDDPSIFVIYHDSQAYPLYVLKFR